MLSTAHVVLGWAGCWGSGVCPLPPAAGTDAAGQAASQQEFIVLQFRGWKSKVKVSLG